MVSGARDLSGLVGELEELAAAALEPEEGEALLEVAQLAAAAASAVVGAPSITLSDDDDPDELGEWLGAVEAGSVFVMGPDVQFTAEVGGAGVQTLSIRSGGTTWLIAPVDSDGRSKASASGDAVSEAKRALSQIGTDVADRATGGMGSAVLGAIGGLGPVRVVVSVPGAPRIDWCFDAAGIGIDQTDIDASVDALTTLISDAVDEATEFEESIYEAAQAATDSMLDEPVGGLSDATPLVGGLSPAGPLDDRVGGLSDAGPHVSYGEESGSSPIDARASGVAGGAAIAGVVVGAAARAVSRAVGSGAGKPVDDTADLPADDHGEETQPTPWTCTHEVPIGGMRAWAEADGTKPPVAVLDAGVQLQVVRVWGAWALVRGWNAWEGWVETALLVESPHTP